MKIFAKISMIKIGSTNKIKVCPEKQKKTVEILWHEKILSRSELANWNVLVVDCSCFCFDDQSSKNNFIPFHFTHKCKKTYKKTVYYFNSFCCFRFGYVMRCDVMPYKKTHSFHVHLSSRFFFECVSKWNGNKKNHIIERIIELTKKHSFYWLLSQSHFFPICYCCCCLPFIYFTCILPHFTTPLNFYAILFIWMFLFALYFCDGLYSS